MVGTRLRRTAALFVIVSLTLSCERSSSITRSDSGLLPASQAPAIAVDIQPTGAELASGEAIDFSAVVRSRAGTVHDAVKAWSLSDGSLGTVSADGRFVAKNMGVAWVRVRSGALQDSALVRVGTRVTPAGREVRTKDGDAVLTFPVGAVSAPTLITLIPADLEATSGALPGTAWEFLPSGLSFGAPVALRLRYREADIHQPMASVRVTPHLLTTTGWMPLPTTADTLTHTVVTAIDHFSTYAVLAVAAVTSVSVQPDTLTLVPEQTITLQATPLDYVGNALPRTVSWQTSDSSIVALNGDGSITARAEGRAVITARSEEAEGWAAIEVLPYPVASISLNPRSEDLVEGDSIQLIATLRSRPGAVLERPITWASSDSSIALPSAGGWIRAVGAGVATVTATSEGVSATSRISVSGAAASTVAISPDSLGLEVGESHVLIATPLGPVGQPVDALVSWSTSDSAVATVSAGGSVAARGAGRAEITAKTAGHVSGTAVVTVVEPVIDQIEITPSQLNLLPGSTAQLHAMALDDQGRTVNVPFVWTSADSAIVQISSTGLVTARQVGSSVISASAAGLSATLSVVVSSEAPASTFEVSPANATLDPGGTVQLNATASTGGGPYPVVAEWVSLAPTIAKVDSSGVVVAVAPGTASIVARLGEKADTAVVYVRAGLQPLGVPGAWALSFQDEFEGPTLDESSWTPRFEWSPSAINGQLQFYSDEAVTLSNGNLVLSATVEPQGGYPYTSGAISSHGKLSIQTGVIEARLRVPEGAGFWPAFWLMPADLSWPPEVDIAEFNGGEPNRVYLAAHWKEAGRLRSFDDPFDGPDFTAGFHVFSVQLEAGQVRWFVDGELRATWTDEDNVPSAPMYVLLNLAVGGAFVGNPDPGAFPASLDVDYVRIWEPIRP